MSEKATLNSAIKKYLDTVNKSIGNDFSEGRVRDLLEQGIDNDFSVSFNAKQILKGMEVNILPVLIKVLGEEQRDRMRIIILEVLANLGEKGDWAVPILIDLLEKDDNETIRSVAVGALNNIIKEADDIIPILVRALKNDGSSEVQRNADSCLIRRANELGHENKEGLIKAYYKDYTEDYIAMGAIEILTARYIDKGQKYFGDGKVSMENLMMAERYFRWAFELDSGPMKKWLHPRLLYIYEKLGYTSRPKTQNMCTDPADYILSG